MLRFTPELHPCSVRLSDGSLEGHRCVTLLANDYHALTTEAKAMCLALGNSDAACRTEQPRDSQEGP